MRIAFVSFGFGEYSIRLASGLAEHAEVGLWLTDRQAAPHLRRLHPGVDFRPFHRPRMRHPFRQLGAINKLRSEIAQFEPDLIHLQQGYLWFNPALALLRQYPLVVTIHDPTPHLGDRPTRKTPQFIADIAYRRADGVIVHNDQVANIVADRGISAERIHVVPHLTLGDGGESPSVDEDGNLILFFGRIWPYKGLEYLIRAEPLITAEIPDARILIAGTGEDFGRYRQMMVHPERFEILNEFIPFERTSELFQRASVVAIPYVDATQSGVIPTAYGFAKPVVSTTAGGLPAQVDDGETGYLVPPRDEDALASAIIRLLKDPDLRARLGANGREKARAEYSEGAVAAKTFAVYQAVLAAHGAN